MRQSLKDKFRSLFGEEWYSVLTPLLESSYWEQLGRELARERKFYNVFPKQGSDLLFKAFRTTPLSKVKVVILGQDPYHDGSFDGFAFSNKGKTSGLSPSLRNIFKEVEDDMYNGLQLDQDPDLERWAKQGVLLINTAHTVRRGEAGSHLEMWMPFTKFVIDRLLERERLVWILWGKKAADLVNISRATQQTGGKHLFLTSPHPSPFSAHIGFFGSKPFSKVNEYLKRYESGTDGIKW